ncbi:metallophosphoesterase [Phormidium sp. LEGE 05292]|uniref:metallophosphoesterase n=1 Tax=[Phormidium] sp. LEGE 05292 TaxID=767427 RepID=UPI00188002F2|nr:metallophosphoesterase [Phormidium sp. LEGE 05292]MBE9226410.1 metallophosphoesterase [Phormidium sp. LEGE 05292]
MRILAIGDIHGCAIAFDHLLSVIQPQPEDQIVTLGDYVDRGLDSKGAIDRLITLLVNLVNFQLINALIQSNFKIRI